MVSPLVTLAAALSLVLHRARAGYRAGRTYRGTRVVTCPDGGTPAAVELDRRRAALTASLGRPWVSVRWCSRWRTHQGCSRECVTAILASPQEGLVRILLEAWAAGRSCALSGCSLGDTPPGGLGPALLAPTVRRSRRRILRRRACPRSYARIGPSAGIAMSLPSCGASGRICSRRRCLRPADGFHGSRQAVASLSRTRTRSRSASDGSCGRGRGRSRRCRSRSRTSSDSRST